uniref:A4_EXTRA domain-containing protein n=1 Tax=Steinernema glaseri TaxID=37863 RepID=A0A1I7ZKG7_9BILA
MTHVVSRCREPVFGGSAAGWFRAAKLAVTATKNTNPIYYLLPDSGSLSLFPATVACATLGSVPNVIKGRMAASTRLLLLLLFAPFATASSIDSVSAAVDSDENAGREHAKFVHLVAFNCGYRNQYQDVDGAWTTDADRYATCLTGKLDILKYCRKVYPGQNITNIVEYSHDMTIEKWCKEDGKSCKFTHTVRPFRCVVGEFRSEALQVSHGCRFGHVNGRSFCKDYGHWQGVAKDECVKKSEPKPMKVQSFAMLEPCGLDMFRGVEFVCCPGDDTTKPKDVKENIVTSSKTPVKSIADDDEDDDDEDDDEDEDDYEEYDDDHDSVDQSLMQDAYFKEIDLENEHDKFREAQKRLDKKHRAKVAKVINEWTALMERYKKMKVSDAKGAEKFKAEMVARFRKTVASLEEENREQRKQIEDVHEERVQASLNEKKRQATHDYRSALALQVGKPNKHNVLKTLKAYIRAEEKDRTHMLNRYRHLLRSDQDEAETFKDILLYRLRYIDLRINGTLAMLRDFPDLEKQVRPIAVEFWREYRRENTPEISSEELLKIGESGNNEKLINLYKQIYDDLRASDNAEKSAETTTAATTTTTTPKKEVAKSLSKEADSVEEKKEEDASAKKSVEKSVEKTDEESTSDEDEDDDDEDIEYADEDEKADKKEDDDNEWHVVVEPIRSDTVRVHDLAAPPAYARHQPLIQSKADGEESPALVRSYTPYVIVVIITGTIFLGVLSVFFERRRLQRAGFIEVDVCTPEERHVNGMQVNGYENPTYSFFDSKP